MIKSICVVSFVHVVFLFRHASWHVRYELYIILCTLPSLIEIVFFLEKNKINKKQNIFKK